VTGKEEGRRQGKRRDGAGRRGGDGYGEGTATGKGRRGGRARAAQDGRRAETEFFLVSNFFFCVAPLGTPPHPNGCPTFSCPWADPNEPNRTDSNTKMGRPGGDALTLLFVVRSSSLACVLSIWHRS
jgi:hypothetical protein